MSDWECSRYSNRSQICGGRGAEGTGRRGEGKGESNENGRTAKWTLPEHSAVRGYLESLGSQDSGRSEKREPCTGQKQQRPRVG